MLATQDAEAIASHHPGAVAFDLAFADLDDDFDLGRQDEGPAVLRLRMLELRHGLRSRRLSEAARRDAEQAMVDIRRAVLDRPHHSFADLVAKLQTFRETHAS